MAKIVVIANEYYMRQLLASALVCQGHIVYAGADGADALDLMLEKPVDLVLADIEMFDMDEVAFCQTVRQWVDVPLLLSVATGIHHDLQACLDAGASAYLRKPFHLRELKSKVYELLEMGQRRRLHQQHRGRQFKFRSPLGADPSPSSGTNPSASSGTATELANSAS